MKRIAVALSGGVDSAVAAALLLEKGYEVFGVTMLLQDSGVSEGDSEGNPEGGAVDECGAADRPSVKLSPAVRLAGALGIEHHLIDLRREFAEEVIDRFVQAYRHGETPNPCIRCNVCIKFGLLLQTARELGADALATGHYAQVARRGETGRYYLRRGADAAKDQSYMLYALSQEQLRQLVFPLGAMTKEKVREEARRLGIWEAVEQKESQDICFIDGKDGDYTDFIAAYAGASTPGAFVDKNGCVLGAHPGIEHFTVGQRKGLGIALGHRVYVAGIDPKRHEIILGNENDIFVQELWADRLNWSFWENYNEFMPGVHVKAKIRYHAPAADAQIYYEAGMVRVVFRERQKAVTPGQAVVFFQGDILLGGGRIVSDFRGIRQDLLDAGAIPVS